jgi:hypothetical protein
MIFSLAFSLSRNDTGSFIYPSAKFKNAIAAVDNDSIACMIYIRLRMPNHCTDSQ